MGLRSKINHNIQLFINKYLFQKILIANISVNKTVTAAAFRNAELSPFNIRQIISVAGVSQKIQIN